MEWMEKAGPGQTSAVKVPKCPRGRRPNVTECREQSSEAGGTLGKCIKAKHSPGLGACSERQCKGLSKH